MPISFLEESAPANSNQINPNSNRNSNQMQAPSLDVKLKARLLLREFASHRYGLFKESGFRGDPAYPPFTSLPGQAAGGGPRAPANQRQHQRSASQWEASQAPALTWHHLNSSGAQLAPDQQQAPFQMRGFDAQWNECSLETQAATGMPARHALECAPFLVRANCESGAHARGPGAADPQLQLGGFNLMSADPFSYVGAHQRHAPSGAFATAAACAPLDWSELAGADGSGPKWYFCGEQFAPSNQNHRLPNSSQTGNTNSNSNQIHHQATRSNSNANANANPNPNANSNKTGLSGFQAASSSFSINQAHNILALNKQNIMCNERNSMDIIRQSDDFKSNPFR